MLPIDKSPEKKRFHFDNLYLDFPSEYDSITLYQIGDLSCKAKYVVEDHIQFCYEISYIFSGEGFFYTNNKKHKVVQGDIFLNLPNEVHRIESDNCQNFRYFYLGFKINTDSQTKTSFNNIKDKLDNLTNPLVKDKLNISIPFLCALKELRNQNEYSFIMINSYIQQILVLMYRNFFSDYKANYDYNAFTKSQKEIAYNVINYFDNNISQISSLTDISDAIGYSYSYLSHVFKEEIGVTLQSYCANRKLEIAKELLAEKELSITEISQALHYESIHSFSKSFKKSTGISPSKFKKHE
jgi:AraC-like DNA-binding protein